jgi:hypothetical protein
MYPTANHVPDKLLLNNIINNRKPIAASCFFFARMLRMNILKLTWINYVETQGEVVCIVQQSKFPNSCQPTTN